MTGFDYAVLAVIGLSLLMGLWRGFVREVLALLGWMAAFWAARNFGPLGEEAVSAFIVNETAQMVAGYALVFVGVLLLFVGISALVRLMITAVGLGLTDRVLGGLFGFTRGLMVVLLAVLICGLTSLPEQTMWREARLGPPLETAVLATKPWWPDGLADRIRYPLR